MDPRELESIEAANDSARAIIGNPEHVDDADTTELIQPAGLKGTEPVVQRAMAGDQNAQLEVLGSFDNLFRKLAIDASHGNRTAVNDLYQVAKIHALGKFSDYDPSKGKISTHLTAGLKFRLMDEMNQMSGITSVPDTAKGRENIIRPTSLSATPFSVEEGASLESTIEDSSQSHVNAMPSMLEMMMEHLDELEENERDVISSSFGVGGREEETNEQIGKRLGGVTEGTIRNIKKKAMEKLRRMMGADEREGMAGGGVQHLMHGGTVDDPYGALGIESGASQEQVKAAYRKAVQQHHPDRNPGDAGAAKRFQDAQAAYDMLSGGNESESIGSEKTETENGATFEDYDLRQSRFWKNLADSMLADLDEEKPIEAEEYIETAEYESMSGGGVAQFLSGGGDVDPVSNAVSSWQALDAGYKDISYADIDKSIDESFGPLTVKQIKDVAKQVDMPLSGRSKKEMVDDFRRWVKENKASYQRTNKDYLGGMADGGEVPVMLTPGEKVKPVEGGPEVTVPEPTTGDTIGDVVPAMLTPGDEVTSKSNVQSEEDVERMTGGGKKKPSRQDREEEEWERQHKIAAEFFAKQQPKEFFSKQPKESAEKISKEDSTELGETPLMNAGDPYATELGETPLINDTNTADFVRPFGEPFELEYGDELEAAKMTHVNDAVPDIQNVLDAPWIPEKKIQPVGLGRPAKKSAIKQKNTMTQVANESDMSINKSEESLGPMGDEGGGIDFGMMARAFGSGLTGKNMMSFGRKGGQSGIGGESDSKLSDKIDELIEAIDNLTKTIEKQGQNQDRTDRDSFMGHSVPDHEDRAKATQAKAASISKALITRIMS